MSADQIIGLVTGVGGALGFAAVFLILFVTGNIHSDAEFKREVARADLERERADRLESAVAERSRALAEANARAEAAVRATEMMANALEPPARRRYQRE